MRKKLISLAATFAAVALCGGIAAYSPTASAETVTTDKMYCAGASIRIAEEGDQTGSGIRFCVEMLKADYLALDGAATGMLVLPTDMADADLTHEDANVKVVDLATSWRDVVKEDVAYVQAYAYLWDIPEDSYNREMSWRGFYGEEGSYVYTETTQSRSVASVALAAEAAGEEGAEEFLLDYDVTFAWGFETDADAPAQTQEVKYGSKAVQPDTDPVREGYWFQGWDYDFNTVVTDDVTVTAKWFNAEENFPGLTGFAGAKGSKIKVYDENTVLVKGIWKNDDAYLAYDDVTLYQGTVIKITMRVESSSDNGGSINLNGAYKKDFANSAEWATYEIPVNSNTVLSKINFNPYNPSVGYDLYISSIVFDATNAVVIDYAELDVSKTPDAISAFSGKSTPSVVYDETLQKNVVKFASVWNVDGAFVNYPSLTLAAGTTIKVTMKCTSGATNGGGIYLNGLSDYKGGFANNNTWATITLTFAAETTLTSLGFKGYSPSFGYEICIASVVIEAPQA